MAFTPVDEPPVESLSDMRRWNDTRSAYPRQASLPELFRAQARSGPERIALSAAGRHISYRELDVCSDQLALQLVGLGVTVGQPVGLLGLRCLELALAMLGILKSGGAYVPLDPKQPPARLAELTTALAIQYVVVLPGHAAQVPAGCTALHLAGAFDGHVSIAGERAAVLSEIRLGGDDLACVLFTSGSTGRPKAVATSHRAAVRLVVNTNYVTFDSSDRVANVAHASFDATAFELWGALFHGGTSIVIEEEDVLDPLRLEQRLIAEKITVLFLNTAVFHLTARLRPELFASLRCLFVGGDVLNPSLCRQVLAKGAPRHLLHAYGPTENGVLSTVYEVKTIAPDAERVPIGAPIANSTCYVLREDDSLADIGEEGELVVGGDGVALGYIGDSERTRARFVADPFSFRPDARLYRTGDRARWLPDGNLDFLGRRDRQVKIRGFRIELDEIEAVLSEHPQIGDACAVVEGEGNQRRISAYYTIAGDGPGQARPALTVKALREFLAGRLMPMALPTRLVAMQSLPLTPTGKIDRERAARMATPTRSAGETARRRPETTYQVGTARLWEEVLHIDSPSLDDDFFDLGGNSLSAAELLARADVLFGIDAEQNRVLTQRLLSASTLAANAEAFQQAREGRLTRDDTGEVLDFVGAAERALPRSLPTRLAPRVTGAALDEILLTGASGFTGTYLLEALLERTRARVHCLVRAGNSEAAWRRLLSARERYRLGPLARERVNVLCGDLRQPRLGLGEETFTALSRSVSLILHAGAYVNFTYPYTQLAPVTVGGTAEIITLATAARVIPVHYISTAAVVSGLGPAGIREVGEDEPLRHPENLYMGYVESKWVAESMLRQAAAAGLPVSIHRLYEISGDLTSGAWNLESSSCALLRAIVDSGLAPDIDLPLNFVPVNVLAAEVAHLVASAPTATCTYHLHNPRQTMLEHWVARLRVRGYAVKTVGLGAWLAEMVRLAAGDPTHPMTAFLPLWVDRNPRNGLLLREIYFDHIFPRLDRKNAERGLAGSGIVIPPVDDRLLDHYLDFFQRSGYVRMPAEIGR